MIENIVIGSLCYEVLQVLLLAEILAASVIFVVQCANG